MPSPLSATWVVDCAMRLAWATDIHLNFLSPAGIDHFCALVAAEEPDAVLLTGDISEAPELRTHLLHLAHHLRRPIYFVLGNHDFYRGSIAQVRTAAAALTSGSEWLHWLPECGVVALSEKTALVGVGGWGDGGLGDARNSPVRLNDARLIHELAPFNHHDSLPLLARLGLEAATSLQPYLADALSRFQHVVVATHVPPWRAACWHEGEPSNDDWLPFFACKAVGDMVSDAFTASGSHGTVLCGHTHSSGVSQILPNLEVRTGAAEYGRPGVAGLLEL